MPPSILLIEDQEAVSFAVRSYLQLAGYSVDLATELEQAKSLLAEGGYSLLIADLRLSGPYGREGLDLLGYAQEVSPETRGILLSAFSSPEIEKEARLRGAAQVLKKPIELSALTQIVRGLLEESD